MANIIICADIHLGIPNKIDDGIWSLKTIEKYALENNIEKVVILGDLFHDRTNLNIEVINKFCEFINNSELEWITFPGNHDLYLRNSWNINSIKPFSKNLTVFNDIKLIKIYSSKFWILPFIHYEKVFMDALSEIESKIEEDDILLTHIGVNNASLNECFLLKNWSVVNFTESKFKRVYTGHFHCKQKVGDNLWYPGSPIPNNFTEGFTEHGFFVFNTEKQTHKFINIKNLNFQFENYVIPPDYINVEYKDYKIIDKKLLHNNKIRIILNEEITFEERNVVKNYMVENNALSVNWLKLKDKEVELNNVVSEKNDFKKDYSSMFKRWVEFDKPKNLDCDVLEKLHSEIYQEALEKISTSEIDNAED